MMAMHYFPKLNGRMFRDLTAEIGQVYEPVPRIKMAFQGVVRLKDGVVWWECASILSGAVGGKPLLLDFPLARCLEKG